MMGPADKFKPTAVQATSGKTELATEYRNAGPPPQRFTPASSQLIPIVGSSIGTIIRLGSGIFTVGYSANLVPEGDVQSYSVASVGGRRLMETSQVGSFRRPAKTLELYEFEGCPFCKKVREAFTMLDLDVVVYPCPKDGATWRPKANKLGGKKQFPLLVDPNNERVMYESDDIIQLGSGSAYKKSRLPEQPLIVWLYEGSPFCKIVREVLSELELPYLQRTVGRGSAKRQELFDKRGTFQAPYLEDPNTKVYMFESAAIIDYLRSTYGVA